MGKNIGDILREPIASDRVGAPDSIAAGDDTLSYRRAKILKPTGAPIYYYDLVDSERRRVGQLHVIVEPDEEEVAHCGHICGFMLSGNESPVRLARAAAALEGFAAESGVPKIWYVVPTTCGDSLEALSELGHPRWDESVLVEGEEHAVFESRGDPTSE